MTGSSAGFRRDLADRLRSVLLAGAVATWIDRICIAGAGYLAFLLAADGQTLAAALCLAAILPFARAGMALLALVAVLSHDAGPVFHGAFLVPAALLLWEFAKGAAATPLERAQSWTTRDADLDRAPLGLEDQLAVLSRKGPPPMGPVASGEVAARTLGSADYRRDTFLLFAHWASPGAILGWSIVLAPFLILAATGDGWSDYLTVPFLAWLAVAIFGESLSTVVDAPIMLAETRVRSEVQIVLCRPFRAEGARHAPDVLMPALARLGLVWTVFSEDYAGERAESGTGPRRIVAHGRRFSRENDHEWRAGLEIQMEACDIAIIDLSEPSENVAWELHVARSRLPDSRIILLVDSAAAHHASRPLSVPVSPGNDGAGPLVLRFGVRPFAWLSLSLRLRRAVGRGLAAPAAAPGAFVAWDARLTSSQQIIVGHFLERIAPAFRYGVEAANWHCRRCVVDGSTAALERLGLLRNGDESTWHARSEDDRRALLVERAAGAIAEASTGGAQGRPDGRSEGGTVAAGRPRAIAAEAAWPEGDRAARTDADADRAEALRIVRTRERPELREADPIQQQHYRAVRLGFERLAADLLSAREPESPPVFRCIASSERDDPAWMTSLIGHSAAITCLCWSRCGGYALSGSRDGTLIHWDVGAARILRRLTGHASPITACGMSTDGALALSGAHDGTLIVWDLATGAAVLRIFAGLRANRESGTAITFVELGPDGRTILSGCRDTLTLRALPSGDRIRTLRVMETRTAFPDPPRLCITPDRRHVLVGSRPAPDEGDQLALLDLESGATIWSQTCRSFTVSSSLCLSPDGRNALSGSTGNVITLRDAGSGRVDRELTSPFRPNESVCFSPDGGRALSASGRALTLWDLHGNRAVRSFRSAGSVTQVCFSPDGARALSGSWDGLTSVWDLTSPMSTSVSGDEAGSAAGIRVSPDGRQAVTASNGRVRVWSTDSGRCVSTLDRGIGPETVQFGSDGRYVLTDAAGALLLRDLRTDRPVRRYRAPVSRILRAALASDNEHVAGVCDDRTLLWWEADSGVLLFRTERCHTSEVSCLAISPDGRRIILGGTDGRLTLRDAASGGRIACWRAHGAGVSSLTWGSRRKVLTGSEDGEVAVWEPAARRPLQRFRGHSAAVTCAAWMPAHEMAVTGSRDRSLALWDVPKAALLQRLYVTSWPRAVDWQGSVLGLVDYAGVVEFFDLSEAARAG